MTNQPKPASSSTSSQASSAALTAANLAAHQHAIATSSSTTSSHKKWVSNGEVAHRHSLPNQKEWNDQVKEDQMAAEIEANLHAVSEAAAKENQGN
jgi:hypothetical protein